MTRTARRLALVWCICAVGWAAAASAGPSSEDATGTGGVLGELHDVDPITATNAWAVGSYWPNPSDRGDFFTLTEHRVAGSWKKVASPNPASVVSGFHGVEALSATNVWAVGSYNDPASGSNRTLIEHWTGSSWKIVASPNPGEFGNDLAAVSAVSAKDIWAVGFWGKPNTLILHWKGAGWKVVTAPDTSAFGEALTDVSARTASDAWAVGYHIPDADGGPQTLIMRWNGSVWSVVEDVEPSGVDNELLGVVSVAQDDAWAVGYSTTSTGDRPLIERWDGQTWTEVPSPAPNPDGALSAVDAVGPDDVWAVGATGSNPVKTFIVHWDGTSWTQVPSPNKVSGENVLLDVNARSATDVWAVGYYNTTAGHKTLILHWNGSAWAVA